MKTKYAYETKIKLYHHQQAAIVDHLTGDVELVKSKQPVDNHLEYHNKGEVFKKVYPKAWALLETQTTDVEFRVAYKLGMMAKAYTNSLAPLRPELTNTILSEELGVHRKKVRQILDKLLKLGVIAKFEVGEQVSEQASEIKKYWIFNPYLSFNGKLINKDISRLFANTFYAKMA